jgi:hypothetical protein
LKIDLEILDGAKVAGRLPATFYASLVRIGWKLEKLFAKNAWGGLPIAPPHRAFASFSITAEPNLTKLEWGTPGMCPQLLLEFQPNSVESGEVAFFSFKSFFFAIGIFFSYRNFFWLLYRKNFKVADEFLLGFYDV